MCAGVACGLAGLIVPAQIMTTVFGGSLITAPTVLLFRGLALNHLVLGTRMCEAESDTKASVPACFWFGSWAVILRRAMMAGTIGLTAATQAYSNAVVAWTATCALVAAFGQGGATATLQKIAEGGGPIPRKEKLKAKLLRPKTLVGVHLILSGFACLAFQPLLLGPSFLTTTLPGVPAAVGHGVKIVVGEYAKHALTLTGVGLTNILLGGITLGGSDRAAAANGVVLLGGWAGGLYYARAAGLFTGQYVGLVALWHALVAASCALMLLDEDTAWP